MKEFVGKGIEELLKELREENKWSYIEVLDKLKGEELTEKDIKKWEYGLNYPDLDMIYKLSEIYQVPSSIFLEAKNNSFKSGRNSRSTKSIKWLAYFLNVSMNVGAILMLIIYVAALVFAFYFLVSVSNDVVKW